MRQVLYYFVRTGRDNNCGHKHRSKEATMACYHHKKIYYPDARIMKKVKLVEWVDELVSDKELEKEE